MLGTDVTDVFSLAGLLGVILDVGAYAALQFGLLRGNGYAFVLANLIGSVLLLISLVTEFNLSSAIVQIIWIGISLFGLTRMFWLDRRARFDEEEQAFIARKFPTMSRTMARAFLDAGKWHEADAGTRLAEEGERLGALIYLAQGEADIRSGRQTIAQCGPNSLIGEMTCFDGGPASATAVLTSPAKYFRITTEDLDRLCGGDFEMRQALHHAVGADIRAKLVETNLRLRNRATGSFN